MTPSYSLSASGLSRNLLLWSKTFAFAVVGAMLAVPASAQHNVPSQPPSHTLTPASSTLAVHDWPTTQTPDLIALRVSSSPAEKEALLQSLAAGQKDPQGAAQTRRFDARFQRRQLRRQRQRRDRRLPLALAHGQPRNGERRPQQWRLHPATRLRLRPLPGQGLPLATPRPRRQPQRPRHPRPRCREHGIQHPSLRHHHHALIKFLPRQPSRSRHHRAAALVFSQVPPNQARHTTIHRIPYSISPATIS